MRKFIVGDLHGNGNVYTSIMSYLDNVSKRDEIILYINGDLIDRGPDSVDMLLDIKRRIEENNYKIIYLAGNHELMMYQTFLKRMKGITTYRDLWFINGGTITDKQLTKKLKSKEEILEVVDFISNLKLYYKFEEKIKDKRIVLVHASCPLEVKDECDLRIKDNNDIVEWSVWTREYDPCIPFRGRIGSKDYFSIVGHTYNYSKYGYEYNKRENYLNIDGGSGQYVSGLFELDHVPLVEINNDYLKILTFNNNNEIVYGNYFANDVSTPLTLEELDKERNMLDKNFIPRKLVITRNGNIKYGG